MLNEWIRQLTDGFTEPWIRALAIVIPAIVVGVVARWVLTRVIGRLASKSGTDLDDKVIAILARPVFMTAVLVGIGFAIRELQVPASALESEDGPAYLLPVGVVRFLMRVTQTLGVLVWGFAILRLSRPVLDSIGRLADRVEWLDSRTVPLFDNFGRVLVVVIGVYVLLRVWGLDVAPWLASAGVVGLALGLAAKDSLANLFGGFFIIVDSPYNLGDFINLDSGERGEVTKIGLRSTRILTRDDIEVTVPNAQIANSKITNEAGGRWAKRRVRIPVGVAYGSDIEQVRTVLQAAVKGVETALQDPEPRVRFRALGESSLDFELLVWIEHAELRGRCVDALLTNVYNQLNAANIEIPFPQRTVHFSSPLPQADG